MSMTKNYLFSLSKEQQDDILGVPHYEDEWTESAANEPDIIERIIGGDLNAMIHNLDLCIQEQAEADREWAQVLAREEGDEQC